jgi:peptidyl-prolyl cis-trans isomerase C
MGRFARGGLLAVAMATGACSNRKSAPAAAEDAAAATAGIPPDQAAQVLAHVGTRTITVGDFVAALEHMDQFDRMRYQAPERRQELLGEMIDVMLLADLAREKGYDQDEITQQAIREILRDAMLRTARQGLPGPGEIPEVEVRAFYDAHRADFHDPERRRVSAIVLRAGADDGAVLEAAKKASPVQWGEIVRTRSIDPRARQAGPADLAGDFGFVTPPDDAGGANPRGASTQLPAEVSAAVFEIAGVGDVLGRLVTTGGRSYIVKLTSKTEPHDRTYAEAERAIRVKVAQDKIRAQEDRLLDDLRKQYPVQIDEGALGEVKVELPRADAGP